MADYATPTAPASWPDTPQFTASADTDILLRNTSTQDLFFVVRSSTTKPTITPWKAPKVWPAQMEGLSQRGFKMLSGESLFVVSPAGDVEFTLQTLAA